MLIDHQGTTFRENIPAYSLGILEAEACVSLEAHLKTCESCRTELAALRRVCDNLLVALPPQPPLPRVRHRLQADLPSAQRLPHLRRNWSFSQLALGISILLLAALNIFSIVQVQGLEHQQVQLGHEIQTGQLALAMLAYPGTQTLPVKAENITGSLLIDKDRNVAVLIIWNLPRLHANQTYQAWFIDPVGERTSAAIFTPDPNLPFTSVSMIAPSNLSNFTGLGLTVEPAGGSQLPTGPRLFKIDF
jgi:anti-sigma-K factor RskA